MDVELKCPYCKTENYFSTESDWERPRCKNCHGVYYFEVIKTFEISTFSENGKESEPTIETDIDE